MVSVRTGSDGRRVARSHGLRRLLALLAFALVAVPSTAHALTVEQENALPGTVGWEQPRFFAPDGSLDAYASAVSVAPGDPLRLHVSTKASTPYRITVLRLGWYGGVGARAMECGAVCSDVHPGRELPRPKVRRTGEIRAGWPVTDTVQTGADWTSGYYVAKISLAAGMYEEQYRMVPFIVRAAPGAAHAMLVQAPVNTWQAYNAWHGYSLYEPTKRSAVKVSFDRPYLLPMTPNDDAGVRIAGESANQPFVYEYQLVRFLESEGYDLAYTTDVDVDRDPAQLRRHRAVIVPGHSEYWTMRVRKGFLEARRAGVSLGFFASNVAYWQIRYERGRRRMVGYKSQAARDPVRNPQLRTTTFRDLPKPLPECRLMGVQYETSNFYSGGETTNRNYRVRTSALSRSLFQGTGFEPGARIKNAVGYEWDSYRRKCSRRAKVIFSWRGRSGDGSMRTSDAVLLRAKSGALIYSAGTMKLNWALDPYHSSRTKADPRYQAFVRNLLGRMLRGGG